MKKYVIAFPGQGSQYGGMGKEIYHQYTAAREVFDYASKNNWVLFFDEFDAIGKSRDTVEEHSELKRVVN